MAPGRGVFPCSGLDRAEGSVEDPRVIARQKRQGQWQLLGIEGGQAGQAFAGSELRFRAGSRKRQFTVGMFGE